MILSLSCSLSVLDVNADAAFPYAELPEAEPTVLAAPPGILKRLVGIRGKNRTVAAQTSALRITRFAKKLDENQEGHHSWS